MLRLILIEAQLDTSLINYCVWHQPFLIHCRLLPKKQWIPARVTNRFNVRYVCEIRNLSMIPYWIIRLHSALRGIHLKGPAMQKPFPCHEIFMYKSINMYHNSEIYVMTLDAVWWIHMLYTSRFVVVGAAIPALLSIIGTSMSEQWGRHMWLGMKIDFINNAAIAAKCAEVFLFVTFLLTISQVFDSFTYDSVLIDKIRAGWSLIVCKEPALMTIGYTGRFCIASI